MHAVCLTVKGEVFMWGNPYYDYYDKVPDIVQPIDMELKNVIQLASGFHHFAIIVSNEKSELYTWGMNNYV